MAGWRLEGMIPLTRQALWRKVEECRLLDISFSISISPDSLPSLLPSLPLDPSPSSDDLQATPPLAPSAPPPLAPMPPPPLRITPFLVAVLKALDYMQSISPAASGILDIQAVIMQNFRRVEAARVVGEWRKASIVEEDTSNKNNRITSKNIFGHVGSATGDEALAMLKKIKMIKTQQMQLVLPRKGKRKQRKLKTPPPSSPMAPRSWSDSSCSALPSCLP